MQFNLDMETYKALKHSERADRSTTERHFQGSKAWISCVSEGQLTEHTSEGKKNQTNKQKKKTRKTEHLSIRVLHAD